MTDMAWPQKDSTDIRRNSLQKFDTPCNYLVSKKPLGEGSYSTVFECKNIKTSKHYAAKRYNKKLIFGLEDMLQNEFSVLKSISKGHPNLLSLVDYFETEKHIYFVTDLAAGGELFDSIINGPSERIPEPTAIMITKQLVDTLDYLHVNNIIHRDIKAENILYKTKHKNSILLADFGLARVIPDNGKRFEKCGTLSYMAPEMLDKSGYDFAVDMWALGVVVYFMLCGYMPFDCETDQETQEAILKADFMFEPPEYWNHISQSAKDFISRCFVVDPKQRLTAAEALMHPFLTSTSSTSYSSYLNLNSLSSSNMTGSHTTLATSASSSSLVAKLKESLQSLQNDQRLHPTALTRNYSTLSQDEKLKGALCESPNMISRFNTPLHSATVSRVQSMERLTDAFPRVQKEDQMFYI